MVVVGFVVVGGGGSLEGERRFLEGDAIVSMINGGRDGRGECRGDRSSECRGDRSGDRRGDERWENLTMVVVNSALFLLVVISAVVVLMVVAFSVLVANAVVVISLMDVAIIFDGMILFGKAR